MSNFGMARAIACLALGCAMWGCARSAPPPNAGPGETPVSASFDGRYIGMVQVAGVASSVNPTECAVEPHLLLQVTKGSFVYVQAHPLLAGEMPSATPKATTPTYTATIAPDGTITGSSGDFGGKLLGRVDGTHMTGHISGMLCDYSFTADRV